MGRFRPSRKAPLPEPRQTVVACWGSAGTHPGGLWTVTITPQEQQEPLLLFVDSRHVLVDGPVTDVLDTPGQLAVTLLHMSADTATILLPAPVVGLGSKLVIPKTVLASVPQSRFTKGSRR